MLSAFAVLAPFAAAQSNLVQVGYSFNQGPGALPSSREVVDYYQNVNGSFTGTISNAPFVQGFTPAIGDYAFSSQDTARVNFDVKQVSGFSSNWSDFTLEMHFKFIDYTGFNNLITFDKFGSGGTGAAKVIRDNANSRLRFVLGGTTLYSGTLNTTDWYHLAITYSASDNLATVYINGNLIGTTNANTLLQNAPDEIVLAANHSGSGTWRAPIDDFRFTNAVLTPEQFLREGFGDQVVIPEGRVAFLLGAIALGGAVMLRKRRKA